MLISEAIGTKASARLSLVDDLLMVESTTTRVRFLRP